MNTKHKITTLLLATLACASTAFGGAYMKLGDIKGEARDHAHQGWIDVLSVSGLAAPAAGQSASARAASSGNVVLTKRVDKATPHLMQACAKGAKLDEVTLSQAGANYVLSGATVVDYKNDGKTETIVLRAHEVTIKPIRLEVKAAASNHNSTRSNRRAAAATDHNTTRSNRHAPAAAPSTTTSTAAQDYNSSRSNN